MQGYRLRRKLTSLVSMAALLFSMPAFALQLEGSNKDAVKLQKAPYFNLKVTETSNTSYKLGSKSGSPLGSVNYGIFTVGSNAFEISKDIALTQGACSTLWGSSTNRDVSLYVASGSAQGTSTSAAAPSTDITGSADRTIGISVDKNPVVQVSLTSVTGLNSGALIAAALETAINSAVKAAGQGGVVDVDFTSSLYVITSRLVGARSSAVVTAGTSLNLADNLKLGVANSGVEAAGFVGPSLCVSDVAGKSTVGSAALGAAGYMSCSGTVPAATPVRQIATADLNCTGPVIGTVRESTVSDAGFTQVPVKKFGNASSATTGTASLVFLVPGLESGDRCTVTAASLGTGPAYLKTAAVTANTITAVADANQTSGTTVINYICW